MNKISIGTKWLNCTLMSHDVWFDNIWKIHFSPEMYRNETSFHSFSSVSGDYLDSEFGLAYLEKIRKNVKFLNNVDFIASSQFIIQNYDKNIHKNESLLILGGGPSVKELDFSSIKADRIWASNNFNKNEKLSKIEIDGVAVTPYVDLSENGNLSLYIKKNPKTTVFFETERGDYEEDWVNMYNFIIKNPSNSFLYNTRYRSKLGITPRQICLAIFMGFKEIYIAGFDGLSKCNGEHGFENQKENAEWYMKFGGPRAEAIQFVQFWYYIANLKKKYKFNIINLSENSVYNMSSEITKCLKSYS